MNNIKVLVVDDSALMRKIISDMINEESDMEVIDTAKNGRDLLKKINEIKPDVITLDIEMPQMDGITTLKQLKRKKIDIPVIVLSSISKRGTQLTMDCLEAGAFDFISKPSGEISIDIEKVKDELIEKIRAAYNKNIKDLKKYKKVSSIRINTNNIKNKINAVVIAASTGGPKALYTVITALPEKIGVPIFIVQHMPAGFTKTFAERLDLNSDIKVVEAEDQEKIEKDIVYIAPGDFHMEVGKDGKIHLNKEPQIYGVRPAADKLFISASSVYGANLLSVVLTGMGRDGSQGTVEVKKNGGITISEDESTCTIYGMPKEAYKTGMIDMVLPITDIPIQIVKIISKFGGSNG